MRDAHRSGPGDVGRPGDTGDERDYLLREMEARMDRRMEALERARRRQTGGFRILGLGVIVALATLLFILLRNPSIDTGSTGRRLSARELVILDSLGIARGRLAVGSDGRAQMSLADQEGRDRIKLAVLPDGSPGVTISDPDGRPRAVLGYLPDGTTNLVFADSRGVSRAVFGVDPDGSTQALFADRDGAIRALVGVQADGAPTVSVVEQEPESK